MSANTTKTTPADVAAKAAEDKLITNMPEQNNGVKKSQAPVADDVQTEDNKSVDSVKVTLKQRVKDLVEKAKSNKNVLGGFLVGTAVGAVSYARYTATKAALLTVTVEDVVDENADQPTV